MNSSGQICPSTTMTRATFCSAGVQHYCTGPRTHVRSTGRIIGFRLLDHFIYDHFHKTYMLVGCVGDDSLKKISGSLKKSTAEVLGYAAHLHTWL